MGKLQNPQKSPEAGKTAPNPACGICQCFKAPPERPEAADAAQWVQQFKHLGRCHRFPTTVPKAPDDYCFDFLAKEI